jgi:methyltransferase family protein
MTSIQPNAQYNVASPDSLPVRLAAHQRRRMFDRFLADTGIAAGETLLDVGVTSDRSYAASNYLEAWYPHKDKVTAVGIDDASFLCAQYPGVAFVVADGLALPFRDRAFDVVHSSAVIEHVGSFARQCAFVAECSRVARRAVFITTPNRWFPVEFHTVLPLMHWLPKAPFRALMRRTGYGFFADEANLNLMTAGELGGAAASANGFSSRVSSVTLFGWPSNLLLLMRRRDAAR